MKSYFRVLSDAGELKYVSCDWCCERKADIYSVDEECVCFECLAITEYEEPEHGLTAEERNK